MLILKVQVFSSTFFCLVKSSGIQLQKKKVRTRKVIFLSRPQMRNILFYDDGKELNANG